jgi:hypothetical protein
MRKLDFLIGRWTGEAPMARGPRQFVDLIQTEDAEYKLDGLLLTIEGVGKNVSDGTPILRIDENSRWTEQSELTIGERPPVRFLDLAVMRELSDH